MSLTLIQDLRWGDTGKGKISEIEAHPDRCDVSVRAVGGGNAGHEIVKGTRKISLHLLPAGCLHDGVDVVLGRGMVTNPSSLLKEIDEVRSTFDTDPQERLVIAPENHVLFEAHKQADAALERRKGKDAVGTTMSGIGPAYADKALRVGMRMEELRGTQASLKDRYGKLKEHWAQTYGLQLDSETEDRDVTALLAMKDRLERRVQPQMTDYWQRKFHENARIVIEGAQGSLLSLDNGGYPYVTSSFTTTNGHLQGAGLPYNQLTDVIGTLKLYDTRVGNGPMRTQFNAEEDAALCNKGDEIGRTTGRRRRTGWLDLQDTARRAWEEGVTKLAVLKGDILDSYDPIRLAVAGDQENPLYKDFPGWKGSIRGLTDYGDLPDEARAIYEFIAMQTSVPIRYIGTGPDSSELITR